MGTSVRGNLYWNTLLRIPVRIVCFFLSIVVARLLDPSDFGVMAIAMMCIGYANLMTNFGLNEAIIQQAITSKKTINSIFTVDIVISIFLAIVFALGAGLISSFFNDQRGQDVIRLMSLVFVVTSFYGIPLALLRRDSNFQLLSIIEMSKSLVVTILTLVLAFLQFGYWALAYGQLIPLCFFTFIVCLTTRWKPRISFHFDLLKPVINFGGWSFLRTQTNFFVSHFEKIIVGRLLGSYSLGLYDKSQSIAVLPYDALLLNINSVMYSTFSSNKENIDVLKDHFGKSIFLISIISLPIYTGMILVTPYFVTLFLGEKWVEATVPLQIILSGYLFKSFNGMLTSMNVAVGKYKEHTVLTIISGLALIFLCLLFIKYGIIGISLSFMFFSFFQFSLYLILTLSVLKLKFFTMFKSGLTGLWSSLVMFITVKFFIFNYLSNKSFLNMFIACFLGLFMYVFCSLLDRSAYALDFKKKIFQDISNLIMRNK